MIATPQETAILNKRGYDRIMSELIKSISLNQLKPLADSNGVICGVVEDDHIPPFNLPLHVRDVVGREYVCIDLRQENRGFTLTEDGQYYQPKLLTETNFLTNLAISQYIWMTNLSLYNPIYFDAARIYGYWLGMKVAKKLVLGPKEQNELIVYFTYFFITRSYIGETLQQMEYDSILNKISNLTLISYQEVEAVLSSVDKRIFVGLDDLCAHIAENAVNPKLSKFNRILLQGILITGWMGINARELVAVASEYPPAFMCLIYRALNERAYKDTDIAQVTLRLLNSARQRQYNLIYSDILKQGSQG